MLIRRCIDLGICPWPMFDEDLIHLYSVYNIMDGLNRIPDITSLYDTPALFLNGCRIIASENKIIDKEEDERMQIKKRIAERNRK